MRLAMLLLFLGLASCSKPAGQPTAPGSQATRFAASEKNFETVGIADLRTAAEAGNAEAQRELGSRMLFGKGVVADPAGALAWVERAAKGGDATAALWVGRKFLNDPPDRIAAGAWFLIASERTNPAIRQDTIGELEALAMSAEELTEAKLFSAKLKHEMSKGSK